MKQIALLFGGKSTEHDVSVKSAAGIFAAIDQRQYDVLGIWIDRSGKWFLLPKEGDFASKMARRIPLKVMVDGENSGFLEISSGKFWRPDLLFFALHGQQGEDGSLQGLAEIMQIGYIGCSIESSAICFNKALLHQAARSIGVMTTKSVVLFNETDEFEEWLLEIGFPVFVKPLKGGSSIGITKVTEASELKEAIHLAFQYDTAVIIEAEIAGVEVGCGILERNGELLCGALDQIDLQTAFFDYKEKYQPVSSKIMLPAPLRPSLAEEIQTLAKLLFRHLHCHDIARTDFFITADEQIYLNEINTFPGFTSESRYPKMFAQQGISYEDLVATLIKNHVR